ADRRRQVDRVLVVQVRVLPDQVARGLSGEPIGVADHNVVVLEERLDLLLLLRLEPWLPFELDDFGERDRGRDDDQLTALGCVEHPAAGRHARRLREQPGKKARAVPIPLGQAHSAWLRIPYTSSAVGSVVRSGKTRSSSTSMLRGSPVVLR